MARRTVASCGTALCFVLHRWTCLPIYIYISYKKQRSLIEVVVRWLHALQIRELWSVDQWLPKDFCCVLLLGWRSPCQRHVSDAVARDGCEIAGCAKSITGSIRMWVDGGLRETFHCSSSPQIGNVYTPSFTQPVDRKESGTTRGNACPSLAPAASIAQLSHCGWGVCRRLRWPTLLLWGEWSPWCHLRGWLGVKVKYHSIWGMVLTDPRQILGRNEAYTDRDKLATIKISCD